MFPIVAFAFAAMIAFAAAATKFPGLGEITWLLSAAAAVVLFGALDAWETDEPAPEIDEQPQ
jgi:hypothetical protein